MSTNFKSNEVVWVVTNTSIPTIIRGRVGDHLPGHDRLSIYFQGHREDVHVKWVFRSWEAAQDGLRKAVEELNAKRLADVDALQDPEGPTWDGTTVTYRGVHATLGSTTDGWVLYTGIADFKAVVADNDDAFNAAKSLAGVSFKALVDHILGGAK